jgi:hypothetical protein
MGGTDYEYIGGVPDHSGQTIKRFTYGQEPQVIALVPLADGGSVLVHGYATFWSQQEVEVAWTDDRGSEYSCWVPAGQLRWPEAGEWRGNYLPR